MQGFIQMTRRVTRIVSLLLLTTFGTVVLMRAAPGYFADEREMDTQYSTEAPNAIAFQQQHDVSAVRTWARLMTGVMRGDFGVSKQYQIPVAELIGPRLRTSAKLVLTALVSGWLCALACALPYTDLGAAGVHRWMHGMSTVLLAVPVSVMAIFCLQSTWGGPGSVLFALVMVRDFRFFSRVLRKQSTAPHLLYARAYGASASRVVFCHVLRPLRRELVAILTMSFVTVLNACIPVEVIFGVPGMGQLAWGAAMNRDLPVLLAVTLLMALSIGLSALFIVETQAQRALP